MPTSPIGALRRLTMRTVVAQETQNIESKHIKVRTWIKRLVQRTICFSITTTMHDVVIGLFINR